MAAITATNVVATIEERTIEGKKKRNRVKLTISATEALTYPSSGGIPVFLSQLPSDGAQAFGKVGMVRNVDYLIPISMPHGPSAGGGILWGYDPSGHAFRGYFSPPTTHTAATGFGELPTTWMPSDTNAGGAVFYVEAVDW